MKLDIKELIQRMQSPSYQEFKTKVQANMGQSESEIMETKHNKYPRELQDYEYGIVHEWGVVLRTGRYSALI